MRDAEALRRAAADALAVQNACNLSGILHSWARAQEVLREYCGSNGSSIYLHHPVNILFMSKVASLMVVNADCIGGVKVADDRDLFSISYEVCTHLAEGNPA